MKKWGLTDSAACECGAPEQNVEHIMTTCPLYRPPSEVGLFDVGPETRAWLQDTELDLWCYTKEEEAILSRLRMLCVIQIQITFATLVAKDRIQIIFATHRRVAKVSARKTTDETRSSRFEQLYRWTCACSLKCSLNIVVYIIHLLGNISQMWNFWCISSHLGLGMHKFCACSQIMKHGFVNVFCINCAAMIVAKVSSAWLFEVAMHRIGFLHL